MQIGVTSTALLSTAFGAVTLSDEAKNFLIDHGWSDGLAAATGVVGVTLIISFVTLVVGELAPKRLGAAAHRGRRAAVRAAAEPDRRRSSGRSSGCCRSSTNGVVRLLGGDPDAGREPITRGRAARPGRRARVAVAPTSAGSSTTCSPPASARSAR